MKKDRLFLLAPGFIDDAGDRVSREYCPECAEVWGLMAYFPAIKESIDISYQPLATPRKEMTNLLGNSHQNCPTLVLLNNSELYEGCGIRLSNGNHFIDNARDIGRYYAKRFGTPTPRGG